MNANGLGLDLVSLSRFSRVLQRQGARFINHVFTLEEQAAAEKRAHPYQHYAARFAAKEAVMKALGRGIGQGVLFLEIEIYSDGTNTPTVLLHGHTLTIAQKLGICGWALSMSHSKETAGAIVLAHFSGD